MKSSIFSSYVGLTTNSCPSIDVADLAFLDDDLAALDDVARIAEHLLAVRVLVVDRDVRIGADAQVPLLRQPERPRRAGRRDDGDLVERVFAVEFRQHDALQRLRPAAS